MEEVSSATLLLGEQGYPYPAQPKNRATIKTSGGLFISSTIALYPQVVYTWQLTKKNVYISYLPLAHIFDGIIGETFIWHGASIGFWRSVSICSIYVIMK